MANQQYEFKTITVKSRINKQGFIYNASWITRSRNTGDLVYRDAEENKIKFKATTVKSIVAKARETWELGKVPGRSFTKNDTLLFRPALKKGEVYKPLGEYVANNINEIIIIKPEQVEELSLECLNDDNAVWMNARLKRMDFS